MDMEQHPEPTLTIQEAMRAAIAAAEIAPHGIGYARSSCGRWIRATANHYRDATPSIVPTLPLNLAPQDILDAREMFDDEVLAQESDQPQEVATA